MKFGKILIEDGSFWFTRHMILNSLPCKDIIWAYVNRDIYMGSGDAPLTGRQMISNSLVIITRRRKHYQFTMTESEATKCIRLLHALNPEMAEGYPDGGRVALESLFNTRDLGGIQTMDERLIMPMRLLRSGDLYHISSADQKKLLEDYHLTRIIDFRSSEEALARPDTVPEGVEYIRLPILDEEPTGFLEKGNLTAALSAMDEDWGQHVEEIYDGILSDKYSVKQFARFMDILIQHEQGAVLWHGGMGKDRTGIATVLLLNALGVAKKKIRADYVRSNTFLESERNIREQVLECTAEDPILEIRSLQMHYQVQDSWLDRMYYAIDREYGSMQNFLQKWLYLTPKKIEELKRKYLL